ncbi:MAG TPA: hypothetical protein VL486_08230 [Verrucomicrobiae bacterium]|nr:hypothetical protein [Verrucomicrobiae bacterium]
MAQASAADRASFHGTEALNSALQQTPDVRPDVVQRAREQASDVEYPPLKTIKAISELLARETGQGHGEE